MVSHDLLAAESIFIFLIIYSITSLLFFFITTNLCFFKFPNFGYLRFIQDTKNLASVNNVLSCYLLITMFSLAGVPPLAGFFSKFFILLGSIKNNLFGLSIFLIIINCLASFYYLRFTKLMFFDFKNSQLVLLPMNYLNSILTTFCVFFLILLILDLDFITAISKLMILSIIQ